MTQQTVDPHDMPASEFYESLTGFDELAIEKKFGGLVTDWAPDSENGKRGDPMRFARALVFIAEKRGGLKDGEAFAAAMNMSVAQTADYFADEPDDMEDPDDPDTETGKDD